MTLAEYSRVGVEYLIRAVSRQMARAAEDSSDDAVHDLRVAIRRLSEFLRMFADLFPRGAAKSVRQELKQAMKLAGATRNCDIARVLMEKAEVAPLSDLDSTREEAAKRLTETLKRWDADDRFSAWREQLHV